MTRRRRAVVAVAAATLTATIAGCDATDRRVDQAAELRAACVSFVGRTVPWSFQAVLGALGLPTEQFAIPGDAVDRAAVTLLRDRCRPQDS